MVRGQQKNDIILKSTLKEGKTKVLCFNRLWKLLIDRSMTRTQMRLAAERPPAWLWRREWNLMRVTMRGTEPPSEWIEYNAGHCGFTLRMR